MKELAKIKDQEKVVGHLQKNILDKRYSHSYAFIGKKGVGKKTTAQAFIKSILCPESEDSFCDACPVCQKIESGNYVEIINFLDTGGTLKIGELRGVLEEIYYKQFEGKYRVIFIENAERMTEESANSLLKNLEEPPPNTIFILTISEPEKILNTILSRLEKYYFNTLKESTLKNIIEELGYEIGGFEDFLHLGTIDELKVLVEYKGEGICSFKDFSQIMRFGTLREGFRWAEEQSKKPYLKVLLSYYEKASIREFKKKLAEGDMESTAFYEVTTKALDQALIKINKNINEKNVLEYCFLQIKEG